MKSILIVGTVHEFQESGSQNPWEQQFREMLGSVLKNYEIQIILEEWNDNRGISIASTLASDKLHWRNVGTPNAPEYDTSKAWFVNFNPDHPTHLMFRVYPFETQERREQFMVERITECMSSYENGLFVVGMNHLHSGIAKLLRAGFEVTAGNWLEPIRLLFP